MHLKNLFLAALVTVSAPAVAQLSWYGGLAGGQSKTDRELVANRESTLVFAEDVRTDFDAKGDAWKAFGGVRFGRHFALEATYADLGKHRMDTTLLGGDPPLPAAIVIDRRITGFGLDAVLMLPLVADRLDLFAKVGVFRARLKAQASLDGNIEFSGGSGERSRSTRRSEDVSHAALGLQYWFTPRVGLRAEWERYASIGKPFEVGGSGTTGQADTDAAWLGVVARF